MLLTQHLQDAQGFFNVFFGGELGGEDVADDAMFVDDKGDATGQEAQHGGDAVAVAHFATSVAEQDKGKLMLGGEVLVRLLGVGTDADHFGPRLFEDFVAVTESAGLGGADGSEVFGIEVENEVFFVGKAGEADGLAFLICQCEVGSRVTDLHFVA